MEVAVEKLPKSQVKLRIELTAEEVRPYLERAAKTLSQEQPPKGFRPGTAPLSVMRGAVGDRAIVERTLKELVPRTYVEAVAERSDFETIGAPKVAVERAALDAPWAYCAEVAVLPDVRLGEYQGIRGTRRAVAVEEAEVNRELETLRKMRASFLSVARPARTGDLVNIDITATADGAPLDPGPQTNQPFLLGEGNLVKGFEERLVGMREGDEGRFAVPFPENHHRAELRGRRVEFHVRMRAIQRRILPALDDRFAQGLGKFATLAELKQQLKANVRSEREDREQQRYQQELLDQVMEGSTYGEFPSELLERELDLMLGELQEGVAAMRLPFDTYLAQVKKTRAELRDGLRPQALRRIRAGLTLRALSRREGVSAKPEEVEEEVNGALKAFPNAEEARERVDLDALRDMAAAAVRNRKVFALLEAIAAANGSAEPATKSV